MSVELSLQRVTERKCWRAQLAHALGTRVSPRDRRALEAAITARIVRSDRRALTDPLTRLFNMRAFRRDLRSVLATPSDGQSTGPALIMIDLVGFKRLNDRLGQTAGDTVLRSFAQAVRRRLRLEDGRQFGRRGRRAGDRAYRRGGDEFALIVHRVDGQRGLSSLVKRFNSSFDLKCGHGVVTLHARAVGAMARGRNVSALEADVERRLLNAKR